MHLSAGGTGRTQIGRASGTGCPQGCTHCAKPVPPRLRTPLPWVRSTRRAHYSRPFRVPTAPMAEQLVPTRSERREPRGAGFRVKHRLQPRGGARPAERPPGRRCTRSPSRTVGGFGCLLSLERSRIAGLVSHGTQRRCGAPTRVSPVVSLSTAVAVVSRETRPRCQDPMRVRAVAGRAHNRTRRFT